MKHKMIVFNTEKDIKKFDKSIWIYKSILYKKTKFVLQNNTSNNSYDSVIEALNIKNRKKRIAYIYDMACSQIDNHNKVCKIDCEFKDGKCINQYKTDYCNGCCRLCKFQSSKGCKSKNLSCKLFFCEAITKKYDVLKFKDIKILKCLSFRNRIIVRDNFFVSRESFLNTLYFNSIIIYSIKTAINIIKILMFSFKRKYKKIEMDN